LIGRKVLQDRQRSVEYTLTKKGEKLIPLITEILKIDTGR
jgi:DNA-binding HxlR family transcriptional regulator